jgi:hypothetical protein
MTRKGRTLTGTQTIKFEHIEHALAIADIYVSLSPSHFLYEPVEVYEHVLKTYKWAPDFVYVHDRKLYAGEVQLTPLSERKWAKKWLAYNLYFSSTHYQSAKYQEWSSKGNLIPNIVVYTNQREDTVRNGYDVPKRELIVLPLKG